MDKLKTFVDGDGGSGIESAIVSLQLAFLTELVFAFAVVQPEDLVVCIDFHSAWSANESDRI